MIEYKEVTQFSRTGKGYEKVVFVDGGIWYQVDGRLHSEDGPAVVDDGYQAWIFDGEFHREDGPAEICSNGKEEYWLNGIKFIPKNYHLFSPLELAKLGLI